MKFLWFLVLSFISVMPMTANDNDVARFIVQTNFLQHSLAYHTKIGPLMPYRHWLRPYVVNVSQNLSNPTALSLLIKAENREVLLYYLQTKNLTRSLVVPFMTYPIEKNGLIYTSLYFNPTFKAELALEPNQGQPLLLAIELSLLG